MREGIKLETFLFSKADVTFQASLTWSPSGVINIENYVSPAHFVQSSFPLTTLDLSQCRFFSRGFGKCLVK